MNGDREREWDAFMADAESSLGAALERYARARRYRKAGRVAAEGDATRHECKLVTVPVRTFCPRHAEEPPAGGPGWLFRLRYGRRERAIARCKDCGHGTEEVCRMCEAVELGLPPFPGPEVAL